VGEARAWLFGADDPENDRLSSDRLAHHDIAAKCSSCDMFLDSELVLCHGFCQPFPRLCQVSGHDFQSWFPVHFHVRHADCIYRILPEPCDFKTGCSTGALMDFTADRLFFFLSYKFWMFGAMKYSGTGS